METWAKEIVDRTNSRLHRFFDEKHNEALAISPEATELVEAVAELTLRGGKRLRPVVMGAACRSIAGDKSLERIDDEAAAIEVLQSYLLIHDDWMDGDVERRGGPAAHAALAARRNDPHLGACLGILAGDLAATYAWELHLDAPYSPETRPLADRRFLALQKEVYFGQQLDLLGHPDVDLMHRLKTGSYTVTGPLVLGALLADATPKQADALVRFGTPLGEAFQLRDDLLGTFGNPNTTGKPAGNDLRAGKHNAIVARAKQQLDDTTREPLEKVLGRADASDLEIAAATELLISTGIRAAVEKAIEERLAIAERALEGISGIDPAPLLDIAKRLSHRSA